VRATAGDGPLNQSFLAAQLLDRHEGEHDRGKAAWTEPTHEKDAAPVQTRPQERQRDREHAHDREAQDGVDDRGRVEVVEDHRNERGSEGEPHDQRQDLAEKLRQLRGDVHRNDVTLEQGAEADPGHEGRDESVALEGDGHGEAAEGCREGRDATSTVLHPVVP
jgi:hypothetical protein